MYVTHDFSFLYNKAYNNYDKTYRAEEMHINARQPLHNLNCTILETRANTMWVKHYTKHHFLLGRVLLLFVLFSSCRAYKLGDVYIHRLLAVIVNITRRTKSRAHGLPVMTDKKMEG